MSPIIVVLHNAHAMHAIAYSVIHVIQKETEDCKEGWWEGGCAEHP